MTIEGKYIGWSLEGFSVEMGLFTVRLARHSLLATEAADLENQRINARLMFVSKDIVLSNVRNRAEVSEITQSRDGQGNIHCILKFSPESSIEITASSVADLQY